MSAYESKKYSWRSGYSYKVSATTVGNVLEKNEKEKGTVTTVDFLEYSRKEDSETHSMFEWDDTVAAEKYRLGQAGKIITQLEVTYEYEEPVREDMDVEFTTAEYKTSAYMNVAPKMPNNSSMFMSAERAMASEETREQVIKNAISELKAFERKYANYTEFAEVFTAIHKLDERG